MTENAQTPEEAIKELEKEGQLKIFWENGVLSGTFLWPIGTNTDGEEMWAGCSLLTDETGTFFTGGIATDTPFIAPHAFTEPLIDALNGYAYLLLK